MHFLKKIIKGVRDYKKSFFTINQTELTTFSKLLMILFFLTSLWLIAAGIESSVRQTTSPQQKYGYQCEKFVNTTYMRIFDFEKSTSPYHDRYTDFGSEPECQTIEKKYKQLIEDVHIQSEISQVRLLEEKTHDINRQKTRLNQQYSNMLLEKISEQAKEKSILGADADTVKKELEALRVKEQGLKALIAEKSNILNYPLLQEFVLLVDKSKERVLSGLEKEQKFYRLKMSMQVFAFLIPIWLLFYFLYRFLAKREKHIFAQLSFYVASAATLYGLVELVQLIYSIIPKIFLAKLIAFFTSHNMIIVLNILGVLFFLLLFGIIIHKIQANNEKKKVMKDTKVLNVKRESCFNCGTRRDKNNSFCAFCGEGLKMECVKCKREIYKYTFFCTDCGEKQA